MANQLLRYVCNLAKNRLATAKDGQSTKQRILISCQGLSPWETGHSPNKRKNNKTDTR